MIKTIERPMSTTEILELPFHVIKDEKEAERIFRGINPEDIFVIQRATDHITFMPFVYFMINRPIIGYNKQFYRYRFDIAGPTEDQLKRLRDV